MALLGAGYCRDGMTAKLFGGTSTNGTNPSLFRWSRTSTLRNQFVSEGITDLTASVPSGGRHPVVWLMPQKAGAIASRFECEIAFDSSATGAMGVNAEGELTLTFDATGTGGLVVSGAGTSAFTITGTVTGSAGLFADGTSSFAFGADATVSALNFAIGTASFTITGTLAPYGIGYMYGSTVDDSIVTNDTIASAVWSKVIEAGYTSEQILRLLAAHAAGAATGLEGADMQFVGLDGVTTRIDGTYSAGTRTIDALDAE
jgi:hypothetical protein